MLHEDITEKILAAFYAVYNRLGYGFLERVYENAMMIELHERGVKVSQQTPMRVWYKGQVVGEYYADLLVEDRIVVELKAVDQIIKAHENQLVNYLKASGHEVGLILNFGPEPKIERRVYSRSRQQATRPLEKNKKEDPRESALSA